MSQYTNIAVLFGGTSSEHEVSVNTGINVLSALDRDRYRITPVLITKSGDWLVGDHLDEKETVDGSYIAQLVDSAVPSDIMQAIAQLKDRGVDVVFLALHGAFGEDGTVQGLLESVGLRYTGSGILGSSLAMDKVRANDLYAHHGLNVPAFSWFGRHDWEHKRDVVLQRITLPVVIKPTADGSSVGTSIVKEKDDLVAAIEHAFEHTEYVMAQECIEGEEATGGVLEIDGALQALPPTQIIPKTSGFFDYHAKYEPGASEEITPAQFTEEINTEIQRVAVLAHQVLGCKSYSRTDVIVRGGSIYILETNTLPGMTGTSLLPQGAQAAGISFSQLLDIIVVNAMR